MNKNTLITGIVYVLAGLSLLFFAVLGPKVSFESLLWGFAGAGIGPGVMMIWRYLYFTRPDKKGEYEARLMKEKIEMHDERRIMLRDRSGRIMYLIMVGLMAFSIFLLSVFNVLGTIEVNKFIIIGLSGLLLLQFFVSHLVYRYLDHRM